MQVETTFSPLLESALQNVCPSNDVLDAAQFDVVSYLNEKFPDEHSLSGGNLDAYVSHVTDEVKELSNEITREVREHNQVKAKQAIASARDSIDQLCGKIQAIKTKAATSETMVQEICADIKALDYAKRHLTETIGALANHMMIASLIDQIEHFETKNEYREMAPFISSIKALFHKFENCLDVPKVKVLHDRTEKIKRKVSSKILKAFRIAIPTKSSTGLKFDAYLDMCAVVDQLDASVKTELLDEACDVLLRPYNKSFAAGEEGGFLKDVERRFAWLRRCLRDMKDEEMRLFISEWNFEAVLVFKFCIRTREHLQVILKQLNDDNAIDTELLIGMLKRTIDFETSLSRKYESLCITNVEFNAQDEAIRGKIISRKENIVTRMKRKQQAMERKEREAASDRDRDRDGGGGRGGDSSSDMDENLIYHFHFHDFISPVFTSYMGGYIGLEAKNLSELIIKCEKEEKWLPQPDSEALTQNDCHFSGSDTLFLYIRSSMNRCAALTKGKILFDIFKEYRIAVTNYGNMLMNRLPTKDDVILNKRETQSMCIMVNTAAYCADTCPGLEDGSKKIIDAKFHEQVDLMDTVEFFFTLRTKAMTAIVNSIAAQCNKALVMMVKRQWHLCDSVGDQSDYVTLIQDTLKEEVPIVAPLLSTGLHTMFCNKLVDKLIKDYALALLKCRRIGQNAAEQLALDFVTLQTILLAVPGYGGKKPKFVRVFQRFVKKSTARADGILKTLRVPPEILIATFKQVMKPARMEDLSAVLAMKGLTKTQQQALVNAYNGSVVKEERVMPQIEDEKSVRNIFKNFM